MAAIIWEKDALMENTFQLLKRHGSLHKVNIKYGYILFGVSILLVALRTLALWFYDKSWKKSSRSTTYLRLARFPLALSMAVLVLAITFLMFVNPHLEKISVLIKRTGRLSYALIPLDLFLAAQPAWFSIDNYLDTIKLHKWVSRIIVTLGMLHGIGFFVYYIENNTLNKVFKFENLLGVVVFVLSPVIMLMFKPVRSISYQFFYLFHTIFLIAMIFLIEYHARPGVGFFFFINICLLISQYAKKYYYSKDITMTEIVEHPGSDYKIVKFPKSLLPESYLPASHVRIGYSKWSPLFVFLPSHPYTVATTYQDHDLLSSLVIKPSKFQLQPFETYSIIPVFKSSLSQNFFDTAENVSIVCGGLGISLGLGIFEYFKRCKVADGRDIKLKFIWITGKEDDLFILNELNVQGVDIFVTSSDSDELDAVQDAFVDSANDVSDIPLTNLPNESRDSFGSVLHKYENVAVLGKRPNLEVMLRTNMSKTIDYANKWVIACGPPSLISDCENIARQEKCRFFSEEYAF